MSVEASEGTGAAEIWVVSDDVFIASAEVEAELVVLSIVVSWLFDHAH